MKQFYSLIFFLVFAIVGCNKDSMEYFGTMSAVIDGDKMALRPDKAKVYVGHNGLISILGRNCSKGKVVIILDVPIAVGQYTLDGESDMSFFTNSALACENESGNHNSRKVIEAAVSVTEVTESRIKGTFRMIAGSHDPQITAVNTIESGVFDVERGVDLE